MKSHGLVVLALALLAAPLVAEPQMVARPGKVATIGILTMAWSAWFDYTEGFRDGLNELGYIEGQTLRFETRAAQGDATRLPQLLAELLERKPDLLYCVAADVEICHKRSPSIPIVFAGVSDPIQLGLAKSFARPGGNITGISNLRAELTAKRLELFKETVPGLRRVLVTYDPREREEQEAVAVARAAASQLALTLLERPITARLEIEPGLMELKAGGRDGILIVQPGTNLNIPGRSLEVATSNKLPTMYPDSFWSKFGALVSYGADPYLQGRQAARLAQKILTGTPPAEIPVELPDRIQFTINLRTAKRLGLEVPRPMLDRADRVIE